MEAISCVYLLPKPFLQKKVILAADMLLADEEEGSYVYEECNTSYDLLEHIQVLADL